jgi:lipopolysaccharide/colanic/teichoic acid biosynthesis glycosyltransferase
VRVLHRHSQPPPRAHRSGRALLDAILKRMLDLALASVLLILVLPLMLTIGLAVRIDSRGPALFRQVRVGHRRGTFVMLKFRTMRTDCSDSIHRAYVSQMMANTGDETPVAGLCKLTEDPRVTRLGRLLRRTSLDELPQLVNVLRGDMSLVGPRPMLAWEVKLLEDRHMARFAVKPGLTGLWQVSGRSALSMRQALELDVEYARRRTMALDLAVLAKTGVVLLRPGQAA